jgi:hypothetical protein
MEGVDRVAPTGRIGMRYLGLVLMGAGLLGTVLSGCGGAAATVTTVASAVESSNTTSLATTTTTVPAATTTSTMSTTTTTEAVTTTVATISAVDKANAKKAFAAGAQVYLYDPQPETVALSALDATQFSLRYILATGAVSVSNVLLYARVDAAGVQESGVAEGVSLQDWTSPSGELMFTTFNLMREIRRQNFPNATFVDDPVFLALALIAPEEGLGGLLVSESSKKLSNVVKIPINP